MSQGTTAMNAFILAAGLGTRLRPLTDTMPKALVPVDGEPMLSRLVRHLKGYGYDKLTINVHHFADMVESFLTENDNFGCQVSISDERDILRDTGGAVRHAAALLRDAEGGRFLVHNVDIVSEFDLHKLEHSAAGTLATLLVSDRKTSRYLMFDESMRLVGWTNVDTGEIRSPFPDLRKEECILRAFSGIHNLSVDILPMMDEWPEKFSIIDFYLDICDRFFIKGLDAGSVPVRDIGKITDFGR